MSFLGQEQQLRQYQDRFRFLYAIVFVAIGILLARLTFLQILNGDKFRQYSEENRIKRVKVPSPRGMIFDRNRTLLIDNRPAFDLEIIPQYLNESKESERVLALLEKIIKIPVAQILATLEKNKGQPTFMPVKIKTDLTRDEVAEIESWKIAMPGVQVEQEIKRTNVYGEVAAHLLGYIGEVGSTELPILNKQKLQYKLGDQIGKFGLEQRLENTLRGVDGEKMVEVDALGRTKLEKRRGRVLAINADIPSIPGKNLILTIDQDLQLAAAKAFGTKSGSLVAVDPKSGQILAMISRPAFDPTEFSRGIPPSVWQKLLADENRPMRDKTIQDHYPPGSVFKVVTAIAGLEEGVINPNSTFNCTGSIRFGNKIRHCHLKRGHGTINVVDAITRSCDVFFYRVSQALKSVDDIAKWADHLGMGKKTGINLAGEARGLVPTEAWKMERHKEVWNPGDTLSIAIGQSYLLANNLQLANLYASIANGGILFRPFIVKEIENADGKTLQENQSETLDQTRLKPETYELVRRGLWGVTNSPHGTAFGSRLPGMDFVGKTGSVQVIYLPPDKIYQKCENMPYKYRHNAMFAGFAPANDPIISVSVVVEHGCHGSSAAAPIAKEVIRTYLEKYHPELYGPKAIAERLKSEKSIGANPSVKLAPEPVEEITPDAEPVKPLPTDE